MKCLKIIIIFIILFCNVCKSQNAEKLKIGRLQGVSHITGCGCYFGIDGCMCDILQIDSKHSYIWVNIAGSDLQLKRCKSTQTDDKYYVGKKWFEFYSNDKYTVQIEFTITWLCPPEEKECDGNAMDATIIVKQGNTESKIKCSGGCGC